MFYRNDERDDYWHMGAGTLTKCGKPDESVLLSPGTMHCGTEGVPFCSEAWDCISRYIYAALQGGAIMHGWTNDDKDVYKRQLTKIPAYSAAKSAVSNLTQWLAVHFSKVGVRVNAIAPGFFVTDQNRALLYDADGRPTPRTDKILAHTPMNRFGEPSDLIGTLLYLCCLLYTSRRSGCGCVRRAPKDGLSFWIFCFSPNERQERSGISLRYAFLQSPRPAAGLFCDCRLWPLVYFAVVSRRICKKTTNDSNGMTHYGEGKHAQNP